jgi:hypothetical protein
MSSEIDTPCRRIPSLVHYCRRGQPFNLHVASLPFVYALRSVAAAHVDGKRCFDNITSIFNLNAPKESLAWVIPSHSS